MWLFPGLVLLGFCLKSHLFCSVGSWLAFKEHVALAVELVFKKRLKSKSDPRHGVPFKSFLLAIYDKFVFKLNDFVYSMWSSELDELGMCSMFCFLVKLCIH